MLTAFHENGDLDWRGIEALTEWYLAQGSAGLFANCQSSEMYLLDGDERVALTRSVVKRAGVQAPVVTTGTFGGPIEEQAEFVKRIADAGVAAVVVIPNQLASAEEDESVLRQRLETLMRLTDHIPLGFYECPAPYHRLLSADLTRWAAATGRFIYLKDTTCDPDAIRAKLHAVDDTPLGLYNANAQSALESLRDGAAGVSPIAANVYPELFSWLCANYASHPTEACKVQRFLRLAEPAVGVQYPASAKRTLQLRGLPITARCRAMQLRADHNLRSTQDSLLEALAELKNDLAIA
jgi:4-hydroxy-tetrahydrodipicolinate synthase